LQLITMDDLVSAADEEVKKKGGSNDLKYPHMYC
jgi:hypothetical protein